MPSVLYKIYHYIAAIPGKISWSKKSKITEEEKQILAEKLASGYYIILTGEDSFLSSRLIRFLSWIKTGKRTKYSHVLMNCDNITDPSQVHAFKFVEANIKGVMYTSFTHVFDCDHVCLLTPKNVDNEEWTLIIDRLISTIGTPYDDLFNLVDQSRMSCVEVVWQALKASAYDDKFPNLESMINDKGNLVPSMYRDCPDFTVAYEKQ